MSEYKKTGLSRREFLKWQAKSALTFTLGTSGLFTASQVFAQSVPDIAIARGGPAAATRAAVELLGGMDTVVKPGHKVVIKPNMSFAQPPENATTTHPLVIKALAEMCWESQAASVHVLDHPLNNVELCLEQSGIKTACDSVGQTSTQGVLREERFRETRFPDAKSMTSNEILKEVLDADVLIAAPVAKHHSSAGVSLSMKGMMGLIYNRGIMHWRYDLHTAIVDLCTFLKADLAVIDATRVLTTNGPGGPGNVAKMDSVVASRDMVAADAKVVSMAQWYGHSMAPRQVKHIRLAHERGLGRMDIENLLQRRVEV